ncbi:hypothetical protein CANCADRAFT_111228 [Tortispora caseinolytica NRRL Y-17796]|uniref:NADPH--cytochrome P450 reductase n=1 Tax=Tortispora caseinolytica NRRL Y-17796 TaxID=767744 RepID=A0A1E4TGH7_9ASCO|nr:hypothetical protein CANCADRAFT_111228 [Tortispora caseinolytica NRRL Y-17796]
MTDANVESAFDVYDVSVLIIILVLTLGFLTKGRLWGKSPSPEEMYNNIGTSEEEAEGNIIKTMEETDKTMVIFFGSQTGTAEDYANRLAKEATARFGLPAMVADLEEYDLSNLNELPSDKFVAFVMATYGEGEPTDNAELFFNFITDEDVTFANEQSADESPLSNLKYAIFGLGNNTYEHYNHCSRLVNKALLALGATRVGPAGEGDEGAGTMEEDYLAWKEELWTAATAEFNLKEKEYVYQPALELTELDDVSDDSVYHGEPNKNHLLHNTASQSLGAHSAHNPFPAKIVATKELFNAKDRSCIHVDIDLTGSNLTYVTGDHAAVWAPNNETEVERLLMVLGLLDKKSTAYTLKAIDPTAKVPFPVPTTYEDTVRYYLEINGPCSRQFLSTLLGFAPTPEAKKEAFRLSSDKDVFQEEISSQYLNIAQTLLLCSNGQPWDKIPFTIMIETLPRLQPRYYSISSSSQVDKKKFSITAVVESIRVPGRKEPLKGVATNYIKKLKHLMSNTVDSDKFMVDYQHEGPRGYLVDKSSDTLKMLVHIRRSNFKLPTDPTKPVIMIGPGTGVAPFRGFVHERATQARNGTPVGPMILFFGSRHPEQDFLYQEEWSEIGEQLGDKFKLVTAFSRVGNDKIYVQHKLVEYGELVSKYIDEGANFYVCGDASHMARDVSHALATIIAKYKGISEFEAEEVVKSLRVQNRYQEDVW